MESSRAIALLRRMQEPEAYEPQITEEAFEALELAIKALGTDTNVGTTNAISRQAAIEAVQNRHMMLSKEKVLLINDLEKLPPAEPKRGKWIVDRYGIVICSECRKPRRDNRIDHIGWCNGCGAKMEGI